MDVEKSMLVSECVCVCVCVCYESNKDNALRFIHALPLTHAVAVYVHTVVAVHIIHIIPWYCNDAEATSHQ